MKMKLIFFLASILLFAGFTNQLKAQASSQSVDVGSKMPEFSLIDQNGKVFNSKDYVGKSVLVIYFYPKDESMVCTKEACSFRDNFNDFTNAGAKVIGINGGSVESHREFSDHYKLPFVLLSDPGNKVYQQFGVKNFMFMTGRKTFVVAKNGVITYSYDSMMQGKAHAEDALKFVKSQNTM
jgi:thioredoxin-dependent peroxiredoxin